MDFLCKVRKFNFPLPNIHSAAYSVKGKSGKHVTNKRQPCDNHNMRQTRDKQEANMCQIRGKNLTNMRQPRLGKQLTNKRQALDK
jgi:hypothetical protein